MQEFTVINSWYRYLKIDPDDLVSRLRTKSSPPPVLRIRIRDPVPFYPKDPGSRIRDDFFPDPGSRIPDPYHVPNSRFYL
jgi:hypothetical protein